MRNYLYVISLFFICFFTTQCGKKKESSHAIFKKLVWSDEFDGEGAIDSKKWFHQTQLPSGGDWYGGLVNHYTDRLENSYVKDGFLHIVARKEIFNDQGELKEYTSARLNSKFAFTYGRVEVKAKLPTGIGTWPAIWMLNKNINEPGAYWQKQGFGTTFWPVCGEVDILEHWGKNQNYVQSAVHTESSAGDDVINLGGKLLENVSNEFHTYALDWYEDKMVFSIDGSVHYTYEPPLKDSSTWPFTTDQYLLLNIAIESDIEPSFQKSAMVVDYVRVYQ
ncbi:glycoside hydrolase family 16 protein [Litoribaculum gwangyangense]|uniref:GH16 domain-containing protein n=1 Tax=Litoribaculum gwangyangense TaxID=1130722 RepID=A0ABP9CN30_9FLAO